MFREGNEIHYTTGMGGNHTKKMVRPLKTSEKKKELQKKISRCKFQLKYAGQNISEKQKDADCKELKKLERQLANLTTGCNHKIKKTYKKMSLVDIEKYSLQKIEEANLNGVRFVTAEDIAHQLNVKPHFVKQVFQKLNTMGVLDQPQHHIPHDSNRDPWCSGRGYSGWSADIYWISVHDEEDED
jgi:hypothetical protein